MLSLSLSDLAIFVAVCWIFVALLSSPFFAIHWFVPGDFSYSAAMYYHGIMVPVLILLYLLTREVVPLKVVNKRLYTVSAILSIFFVGMGSIFNASKGISVAAAVQILGMVMTDCLGIALVAAMAIYALGENRKTRKTGTAFWLLFSSITVILIAAPLGHLAGWCIDIGAKSIPGLNALLRATNINPDDFQDGLVASHSHLIVAAFLCGLAAVTAIYFQYQSRDGWRKRISILGLWIALISLLLATGIYVLSALVGWEPPVVFASGPSGIPLDDVVLTIEEIGFLVLMVGLSGSLERTGTKSFAPIKADIRISIFLNWIFGFAGAVLPGIYIELNEGFYGAGMSPALGALNDNIFIRAHLLYPFLLLPIIFAVTLAVGCKYNHSTVLPPWPRLFVWTSVFGMSLGLTGEILWFVTRGSNVFLAAIFVMGIALITGMISLWPNGLLSGYRFPKKV
ncbi:MAG: hypothetical protein GXP25_03020 [Planctomycetes bacterium]|nr:hypothetical protein [Planctomycetota bacterium]